MLITDRDGNPLPPPSGDVPWSNEIEAQRFRALPIAKQISFLRLCIDEFSAYHGSDIMQQRLDMIEMDVNSEEDAAARYDHEAQGRERLG